MGQIQGISSTDTGWNVSIDGTWIVSIDGTWIVSIDEIWIVSIDGRWIVSWWIVSRRTVLGWIVLWWTVPGWTVPRWIVPRWTVLFDDFLALSITAACRLSIDVGWMMSICWWCMLSIDAAWRVSINTSLLDLKIMHRPACSFLGDYNSYRYLFVACMIVRPQPLNSVISCLMFHWLTR